MRAASLLVLKELISTRYSGASTITDRNRHSSCLSTVCTVRGFLFGFLIAYATPFLLMPRTISMPANIVISSSMALKAVARP